MRRIEKYFYKLFLLPGDILDRVPLLAAAPVHPDLEYDVPGRVVGGEGVVRRLQRPQQPVQGPRPVVGQHDYPGVREAVGGKVRNR